MSAEIFLRNCLCVKKSGTSLGKAAFQGYALFIASHKEMAVFSDRADIAESE